MFQKSYHGNRLVFLILIVLWASSVQWLLAANPSSCTYDITHYRLNLELSNLNTDISGNVLISANLLSNDSDSIILQLTDQALIDSILYNNLTTVFNHNNDFIAIPISSTPLNSTFQIQIYYSLTNAEFPNNRGILHRKMSSGKSITWTITEPFYAFYWFPCKQDLEDKIDSASLFFTVDDSLLVGSNGVLTNITTLGNEKKRFEWKTHYPTAFYLFSFSVADYIDYSFYAHLPNNDSVLVQNYVYNDSNLLRRNRAKIDASADLLNLFSELYGVYPFLNEKYGHCLAPTGGGMEHQTMTTLGNFSFQLVAHELAHQWFGNSITCSSWHDIWINEGFATYSEYVAIENLKSASEMKSWLSEAHALVTTEPDGSVYVPDSLINEYSRVFDYRTTYQKGGLLLHMIRHRINNDELFFSILKNYGEIFKYSVASAEDFKSVLEEQSGIDFTRFFDQWYYGEGYPILDITWHQEKDSLIIEVNQEPSTPAATNAFELFLDFNIDYLDSDTLIQQLITKQNSKFGIKFNKRVFQLIPNPNNASLVEIRSVRNTGQIDNQAFNVFPNPASNMVYIENYMNGLPFQAHLYNNRGVLIDHTESSRNYISFSINHLNSGTYKVIASRQNLHEVFTIVKL